MTLVIFFSGFSAGILILVLALLRSMKATDETKKYTIEYNAQTLAALERRNQIDELILNEMQRIAEYLRK